MDTMLQTERLLIRKLTTADAAFVLELVNSPGWLAYIGDRQIRTVSQAETYLLNGPLASYEANGFGLYLVERKAGKTPIGMCGLIRRTYLDYPDIGFAFLPAFMGNGYAVEAATAIMHDASETLKLPVICALVMPSNGPSISLLGKLGMTYRKPFISPDTNDELMLFSS
ncbi:GNAT family N-acetyltransferase [Fibrivirga algicola]|nr:GNAT family N-acetyltransferase [Fibrivirga algicola]